MPYIDTGFVNVSAEWGGNYYIAGEAPDGIVTIDGVPASRIVRLVDRRTGIPVRQTMSAPDGTYRFEYIRGDTTYMVIGIDQFDVYQSVAAGLITAVPLSDTSGTQPGSKVALAFGASGGGSYPDGLLRLRSDGRIEAVSSGSGDLPSGALRITALT